MKRARKQTAKQVEFPKLEVEPYQYFEGVDYQKIMSLNITSIKIDSENQQLKQENIPKKLSTSLKKLAAQDESKIPSLIFNENQMNSTNQSLQAQQEEKEFNRKMINQSFSEDEQDSEKSSLMNVSQNHSKKNRGQNDETGDLVYVCALIINIETISKAQILKLRKLMPRKDYRQLKNRKSARECRKKRKAERYEMINEIQQLKSQNIKLQEEITKLKKNQNSQINCTCINNDQKLFQKQFVFEKRQKVELVDQNQKDESQSLNLHQFQEDQDSQKLFKENVQKFEPLQKDSSILPQKFSSESFDKALYPLKLNSSSEKIVPGFVFRKFFQSKFQKSQDIQKQLTIQPMKPLFFSNNKGIFPQAAVQQQDYGDPHPSNGNQSAAIFQQPFQSQSSIENILKILRQLKSGQNDINQGCFSKQS